MISKKEHLLAAFIFLLWSLGVVVLPVLDTYGGVIMPFAHLLWWALWYVYLALHGAVFIFAGHALFDRGRRGKLRGMQGLLSFCLYAYTVAMLGTSVYFLIQSVPVI